MVANKWRIQPQPMITLIFVAVLLLIVYDVYNHVMLLMIVVVVDDNQLAIQMIYYLNIDDWLVQASIVDHVHIHYPSFSMTMIMMMYHCLSQLSMYSLG